MKIKATFFPDRTESNSKEAYDLFSTQAFGERIGEKIVYSTFEAFYLFETGRMDFSDSRGRILNSKEITKRFEKDKNFRIKYLAFRDLRKKGYIVKSALKFGADFRVYEKGTKDLKNHSKWILYVVSEKSKMNWQDFASKNRVAHSVNKKLLMGIVDSEEDVSYFEVSWTRT